jgi:hypothetical protein
MGYRKSEANGHGGVNCITARAQNRNADFGGQILLRYHHSLAGVNGLASVETRNDEC